MDDSPFSVCHMYVFCTVFQQPQLLLVSTSFYSLLDTSVELNEFSASHRVSLTHGYSTTDETVAKGKQSKVHKTSLHYRIKRKNKPCPYSCVSSPFPSEPWLLMIHCWPSVVRYLVRYHYACVLVSPRLPSFRHPVPR